MSIRRTRSIGTVLPAPEWSLTDTAPAYADVGQFMLGAPNLATVPVPLSY